MKIIFIIAYAIYLFTRLDAFSAEPYLERGIHSVIWVSYVGILFVLLLRVHVIRFIKTGCFYIRDVVFVMIPIFTAYLLAILAEYTAQNNVLAMLAFIAAVYFTGRVIYEYQCVQIFLAVSYFLPLIYIILHNTYSNFILSELFRNINFSTYFSMVYATRFRFDFGFNNSNAIGNIAAYLICISFLFRHYADTKNKKRFITLATAIGNVFCLGMLLITGCRSGILVIAVFAYMYTYLRFMQNAHLAQRTRKTVKYIYNSILIIAGVFLSRNIIYYYMHSGRQYAFENFKLLNTVRKILFGIGIPENFSLLYVDGNRGNFIDNYYVYIIVTTGVIGACLINFSLIAVGKNLYENIEKEKVYVYLFSYYAALLIYGFVEAGVFNSSNFASGIYFSLFFALYDTKRKVKVIARY